MNILIVRLGALGDIVHTVPAAAALRRAFPDALIDWVVDARHAEFTELVTCIDHVIRLEKASVPAWIDLVRRLRPSRYDVALDFQGLMKSAVVARASGARRVIGFSVWHLREKTARPFYSEVDGQEAPGHVIRKNLGLLSSVGVAGGAIEFPLARSQSAALDLVHESSARAGGPASFALINPGAAWPNKRWPAARFGDVASFLRDVRGLTPFVLWGPGEGALAQEVIDASSGAARLAPPTTTADLLELSREAALMVSGDTGPLHIAAAAGAPVVGIFGPTDPARNGPWSADDVVVSRHLACGCHYERRCRQRAWCLEELPVAEVTAAIQQRLAAGRDADR
jgi:lipopolysaccharide heptosyltransferase I